MSKYYVKNISGPVFVSEVMEWSSDQHHAFICACTEVKTAEKIAAALNEADRQAELNEIAESWERDAAGYPSPGERIAALEAQLKREQESNALFYRNGTALGQRVHDLEHVLLSTKDVRAVLVKLHDAVADSNKFLAHDLIDDAITQIDRMAIDLALPKEGPDLEIRNANRPSESWHIKFPEPPAEVPEPEGEVLTNLWTDEQCREFCRVAFRHRHEPGLPTKTTLDDIRIGAHFAMLAAAEPPPHGHAEP